jgi:hypothetical protein
MNWEKIHKDIRLRMNISLYGALAWNTAYALLNLGMGLWHRSFWFCSLAAYYVFLAVMRFFLVRYTSKNKPDIANTIVWSIRLLKQSALYQHVYPC